MPVHTIVFAPGIMGTRLILKGEEVWPPTVWEAKVGGYARLDKLIDPEVKHGKIISSLAGGCYDVYEPLLQDLSAIAKQDRRSPKKIVEFPYDWRLDLFDTAERLATKLIKEAESATTITLIGHSMGGLICRLVLENPAFRGLPWHSKIGQYLGLAVPNRGATLALARALGLDETLGISGKDFQRLAADTRYPAGYQLLPWRGDAVMWNRDPNASLPLQPIDFYKASEQVPLNAINLGRALAVQQALSIPNGRPPYTRYISFAGTRYTTVDRIDRIRPNAYEVVHVADGGDGTVPGWSGILVDVQHQYVGTDHQNIFTDDELRRTLYRLLGAFFPGAPYTLAGATPQARLSTPRPVWTLSDSEFEVQVQFLPKQSEVEGTLIVEQDTGVDVKNETTDFSRKVAEIPVTYKGPSMEFTTLYVAMVPEEGLYRIRLESDTIEAVPLIFVVRKSAPSP